MGHTKQFDHNYAGNYFLEQDCPPTVQFRTGGVYDIPPRDEILGENDWKTWARTAPAGVALRSPRSWIAKVKLQSRTTNTEDGGNFTFYIKASYFLIPPGHIALHANPGGGRACEISGVTRLDRADERAVKDVATSGTDEIDEP